VIVGIHPQSCGVCNGKVSYRTEPSVPAGVVFYCVNPQCAFRGVEHNIPTIFAPRFYAQPKGEVA
jgi:hypothetical protein